MASTGDMERREGFGQQMRIHDRWIVAVRRGLENIVELAVQAVQGIAIGPHVDFLAALLQRHDA
jgi:hypothetical protein